MKFELRVYELQTEMKEKSDFIDDFSKKYLEKYFSDKTYGKDVENIAIVIILIKTLPGYENWNMVRRPKYIEHYESTYVPSGIPWEWNKRFVIETRFDFEIYDEFLAADEEEAKRILARETLQSLELLDKLPKRLKDFDINAFRADVKNYYRQQGWIE